MILKILHLSRNKQKKINKLVDERYEQITDLDINVNSDDLIFRYKGNTEYVKFEKFDNALNIINKIKNGEIELKYVKNNQEKFRIYLGEIKKRIIDKRTKKHFVQYGNALQSKKRSYKIFMMVIR